MINREIKFTSSRQFGIELEYNSPNKHDFYDMLVEIGEPAIVSNYCHTNNPTSWYCKKDSSCGYEVSSKVLSGVEGIKLSGNVLEKFKNGGALFNNRCGQHIHINTTDFTSEQRKILGCWWIKIEHTILNAHPEHRRNNNYCRQANSLISFFEPNRDYSLQEVWDRIYYERGAINFNNRDTTEFRFGHMTHDSEELKNRIRFLIWFVSICKFLPKPQNMNWFSPKQILRFMGLWNEKDDLINKIYSPSVKSMREWLLSKFLDNAPSNYYERDKISVSKMIEEIRESEVLAV